MMFMSILFISMYTRWSIRSKQKKRLCKNIRFFVWILSEMEQKFPWKIPWKNSHEWMNEWMNDADESTTTTSLLLHWFFWLFHFILLIIFFLLFNFRPSINIIAGWLACFGLHHHKFYTWCQYCFLLAINVVFLQKLIIFWFHNRKKQLTG